MQPTLKLFGCLALSLLANTGIALSAPVTLSFDAVVEPPRQGAFGNVPPQWGILVTGDTISGTLTFDPLDVASSVATSTIVENHLLSVQIKNHSMLSSAFEIQSVNNWHGIDSPDYDSIQFGCNLTACNPATVQGTDGLLAAIEASLYGSTSVLDGADIPADLTQWQQLSGEIIVDMQNNTDYYGFLASITSFNLVAAPEPTSAALFAIVAMIFGMKRSRNRFV